MPPHRVERETDQRDVALALNGFQFAARCILVAFQCRYADVRNFGVQLDAVPCQVCKFTGPGTGFHQDIDDVARIIVQIIEVAGRQDDIADEFRREGRPVTVLAAFLAKSRERVIKAQLVALDDRAKHRTEVTQVLVHGVDLDVIVEHALFPPFGIGDSIVAADVFERLISGLIHEDLRRALVLRLPFLALAF